MSTNLTGSQIRTVILQVIEKYKDSGPSFQTSTVINEIKQRLNIPTNDRGMQQAVLTIWNDLFREGYLSWGLDLGTPDPPFLHISEKGRRILRHLSRDPGNPDGYIEYIRTKTSVSDVTKSYLMEALGTYNYGFQKASAVMIGAATENMILELRNCLVVRLTALGRNVPRDLNDRMIKKVLLALSSFFDGEETNIPKKLFESYQANWGAFTQQIRKIRNDAGHPENIEAITEENVHASLLIFPELAGLIDQLKEWITKHLN